MLPTAELMPTAWRKPRVSPARRCSLQVLAADPEPSKCVVAGDGRRAATQHRPASFTVSARDRFGNAVAGALEGRMPIEARRRPRLLSPALPLSSHARALVAQAGGTKRRAVSRVACADVSCRLSSRRRAD